MSVQDVFWSQQVKEADECMDPDTRKRKRPRKALYDTSELQELLRNYEEASQKVSSCLKRNVEVSVALKHGTHLFEKQAVRMLIPAIVNLLPLRILLISAECL